MFDEDKESCPECELQPIDWQAVGGAFYTCKTCGQRTVLWDKEQAEHLLRVLGEAEGRTESR